MVISEKLLLIEKHLGEHMDILVRTNNQTSTVNPQGTWFVNLSYEEGDRRSEWYPMNYCRKSLYRVFTNDLDRALDEVLDIVLKTPTYTLDELNAITEVITIHEEVH